MVDDDPVATEAAADPARRGPTFVSPSTRVNVALPFSKLTVEVPSAELAELAAIVAELAALVAEAAPGPEAERLVQRAVAVSVRLGGAAPKD